MEEGNSSVEGLEIKNDKKQKLLSIYIPTYNREKYILNQLTFLLNEIKLIDKSLVEIIVNDNCSTDNTQKAVAKIIEGTEIIYHCNSANLGIGGNMYLAAKFATGKYLWVIGDDDILNKGIVKRVVDILNSDTDIGYVFLNYAPIEDPDKYAYNGPDGLVMDGSRIVLGKEIDNLQMVILSSASIYTRTAFVRSTEILPLRSEENYGINGYASLASMKRGKTYFEKKVWLYNDAGNMSWKDIVYESNMGVLRMFRKLTAVGYSKADVSKIYHAWITRTLVAGKILHRLTITKDIKRYIKDTGFCLRQAPDNVIRIYGFLIINKVRSWIKKDDK